MTARTLPPALAAAVVIVALAVFFPAESARGFRIAFLTASAPVLGAVLLLAIARLVGADWRAFEALARAAPIVAVAAIGVGIVQIAAPPPPHLALWQHPVAAGARALIAAGALALAGSRLARGAAQGFAGITLALYAAFVTPVAMDWLLGGDPAHSVSAAGMMLFVEQIGGACAMLLLAPMGDARMRRDMAKLLVAAALALGYLAFMDYLILWYGDVPSRAGWYVARTTLTGAVLAGAALIIGLAVPIAALALLPEEPGHRIAGLAALTGLLLFNLWWVGAGAVALIAAFAWLALATSVWAMRRGRETAHG